MEKPYPFAHHQPPQLSSLLLKLLSFTDSTQALFIDSHHPYPQTLTNSSTSSSPPLKLTHHRRFDSSSCSLTLRPNSSLPKPLLPSSAHYLPQSQVSLFSFSFILFYFYNFFYNDFCDMICGQDLRVKICGLWYLRF